jgi:glycosyltransferase involved in cell wall biosynthesis
MSLNRFSILIDKVLKKTKEIGLRKTISLVSYKLYVKLLFRKAEHKEESIVSISIPQNDLPISYKIILEGLRNKEHSLNRIINQNFESLDPETNPLEFVWLVPFFSKGSGGHKNLFRFIKGLESLGCKCTVYIVGEYDLRLESEELKKLIWEYFEPIHADIKIYNPEANYEKASILVCTAWITAYAALKFDSALKIYFVQDYEPYFFSSGSYWYLAEHTYSFGYYHLTLGPWLTHLLKEKHGVQADYYDISVDTAIYYPRQELKNKLIKSIANTSSFKVCFYGRSVTPRRCFEIVVMALHLFAEKAQDITLISYGWNEVPPLSFPCQSLGMLSPEDLAELYSICDVCIAPSATNLSLVAREVMACGCVLMDIDVENTSYDLVHLYNSYLVKPDPVSMYDGLLHLYNDRQLLANIKASSLEHISQLSNWGNQVKTFYNLINSEIQKMNSTAVKKMSLRDYLSAKYIFGQGIEIGALHNPINVSSDIKVKYVDRSNLEALKAHYPELANAGCNFVDVDIIDDGETLSKIEKESQDFVIANHFIEHCEDPIRTFQNHLRVLKPGGILYMAVPDKTLTFDRDRPVTTTEHMVTDYLQGPETSREAHFYEWVTLVLKAPEHELEPKVRHLMETKYSIHFHVFTPESFLNFIFSVKEYIGIPFELRHFCRNEEEIEFICLFQRS